MEKILIIFKTWGSYSFFNYMAFGVLILYNLSRFREKKQKLSGVSLAIQRKYEKVFCIGKIEFWTVVEILLFSAVQYVPSLFLNPWFGQVMQTGANYFGILFFSPFIVIVFSVIVRANPLEQLDIFTPALPLALASVKLGCARAGCCSGVEWAFDSVWDGKFPIQLLEFICALVIFVVLCNCRKKLKTGHLYPLYLILYCMLRFLTEFLRCENNVFGPLKIYHLICIIGIIIGITEWILVDEYRETQ